MLRLRLARIGLIVLGLGAWFFTQSLISARGLPTEQTIGDAPHEWTAGLNAILVSDRGLADALLITSSTVINLLAAYLFASAIFGRTVRPFVGLIILFGLRQLSQGLNALPAPPGLIWHDPGFPGGLVTYSVGNDFFFSGHTAIAVYGAYELARRAHWSWKVVGTAIAIFEVLTVIVLRAHWTMDVFAGIMAALWVASISDRVSPYFDRFLDRVGGRPTDSLAR